jgi:hypothetical protein
MRHAKKRLIYEVCSSENLNIYLEIRDTFDRLDCIELGE